MAQIISYGISPQQAKEARLIEGMLQEGRPTQYELYVYCADYFRQHYRGIFFANEEVAAEILQNAFITLWENIENHKIYTHEAQLTGKNGQPLKGSILTYFMSIARNKYREYLRDHPLTSDTDLEQTSATDGCIPTDVPDFQGLYDASDNTMIDIIAEVIANMSPKCYEILTKFYYEEKNLEVILSEIDSIESKDALKTKKYKCMETLRRTAHDMYQNFLRTE